MFYRIHFEEQLPESLIESLNDIGVNVWYGNLTSKLEREDLLAVFNLLVDEKRWIGFSVTSEGSTEEEKE